jgi:hypothetical protein
MGKRWDPWDLAVAQEACEAYAAYAIHTGLDKTGTGLGHRHSGVWQTGAWPAMFVFGQTGHRAYIAE